MSDKIDKMAKGMFLDQQSTCSPHSSPAFPSAWKEIPLYQPLSCFLQAQEPMRSQVDMDTKLQPCEKNLPPPQRKKPLAH